MNKTKIPWATHSINPVKGLCPRDCEDLDGKSYCYARKMYRRFHWDEAIRYEPAVLWPAPPIGSRVFVGSTIDLFGPWVPHEWLQSIFSYCEATKDVTWLFLTKSPERLGMLSPFPRNIWVGATVTDKAMADAAGFYMWGVKASVKFVSIEPLLGRMPGIRFPDVDECGPNGGFNWVILGSRTQPVRHPPREWVDEIIKAADGAGIPVFVKEPMASFLGIQRQEFPKEVKHGFQM